MPVQPDLSIIIINWNSAAFLRKCLASIYANQKGLELGILVVDNASYDGCDEMLAREFPRVRFIQNQENTGFARANNLGFSQSRGRNLLFLNPDTEVIGPALQVMLSCLEATPDAGIVGPKLLNSDLSIQTTCIQRFPTILNQALEAEYLRVMFPHSRLWGISPLYENPGGSVAVEVVSGACLMIRRSLFEKVGFFNTDYFMYAEDVDLCYRVQQAGLKAYYVGQANVIHHGGRSVAFKAENNFAALLQKETKLMFLKARRGRVYATAYQVTTALAAVARLSLLGLILALTLGRFQGDAVRAAWGKWTGVLRWAIGLKGWVKSLTQRGLRKEKELGPPRTQELGDQRALGEASPEHRC